MNELVEIDGEAGLWAGEKRSRKGWHWRMPVVELEGGGVVLISPIRQLPEEIHGGLVARGGARVLVAPNHFHYLGLGEYCDRYPEAEVVCSAGARPRLEHKTQIEYRELATLEAALPGHVSVLSPPALRTGEIWLRVETSRGVAWVVGDAFFNLAAHPAGAMGLFCRLTLTTCGLRIGRTFTGLAVSDIDRYREWLLAQIDRDEPRVLVPAHGEVLESDALPAHLEALAAARLS